VEHFWASVSTSIQVFFFFVFVFFLSLVFAFLSSLWGYFRASPLSRHEDIRKVAKDRDDVFVIEKLAPAAPAPPSPPPSGTFSFANHSYVEHCNLPWGFVATILEPKSFTEDSKKHSAPEPASAATTPSAEVR
jgi:hypothetical protein